MVIEITPKKQDTSEIEELTGRVFFKTFDLVGGLMKLAEFKSLTWLPSLARASFVIVLKEEYMKTEEEIAKTVGLTKNTVKSILRADPEIALKKIQEIEFSKELKIHMAGAIARLAYKEVKEGKESKILLRFAGSVAEETAKILDVPWAYNVLKHIKGMKYPVQSAESLKEFLTGINIKGISIEKILPVLKYPVNNPAELLHGIKEAIEKIG